MAKHLKYILITVVGSLVAVSSAFGQTCTGATSFHDAPLQVGAEGAFSSDTHSFLGGVADGNDKWFGRVGGEFLGADGLTEKGVFGSFGLDPAAMGPQKQVFFCPIVTVLKGWGPNPGPDFSDTSLVIEAGGSVGFEAMKTGTTEIVPTVTVNYNYLRESASETGFTGGSSGSSFGDIQFGVGLIFNENASLVPTIVIPFKFEEGSQTAFSVLFTMKLK